MVGIVLVIMFVKHSLSSLSAKGKSKEVRKKQESQSDHFEDSENPNKGNLKQIIQEETLMENLWINLAERPQGTGFS